MTDDDFDDLDIQPDEADDGYRRISAADLKRLRQAARKAPSLERQLGEYQRRDAVTQAGIEGLTSRQIAVIAKEAEGDQSPENLRKIAEELGFVKPAPPSEEEQQREAEIDGHAEAVAATTGAAPVNTRVTATADEIASWPMDKLMRLDAAHPDIYELAMRGEAITLPPGFN